MLCYAKGPHAGENVASNLQTSFLHNYFLVSNFERKFLFAGYSRVHKITRNIFNNFCYYVSYIYHDKYSHSLTAPQTKILPWPLVAMKTILESDCTLHNTIHAGPAHEHN